MHLWIGPMDNAPKKTLNPEAQHTINLKPKAYSPRATKPKFQTLNLNLNTP